MDYLKDYIQSTYGTCKQAESEGKCDCLYKKRNQKLCPNWVRTTANNWEEMIELAKKQYKK